MRIAGKLTTKDWEELVINLNSEKDENWGLAFHFFEERIKTRYLNPIDRILGMDLKTGEGIAVVTLQCSLIETIESFINGWKFNLNPYGWFKLDGEKESKIKKNQDIFISFFEKRNPFVSYNPNIDGGKFYQNVRCGLLHETQTKGNWRIKSDSKKCGLSYEENNDKGLLEKIIYRENFQKDLETLIENYKKSIIDGIAMNGIPVLELRENFIAKFNYLCSQSE